MSIIVVVCVYMSLYFTIEVFTGIANFCHLYVDVKNHLSRVIIKSFLRISSHSKLLMRFFRNGETIEIAKIQKKALVTAVVSLFSM